MCYKCHKIFAIIEHERLFYVPGSSPFSDTGFGKFLRRIVAELKKENETNAETFRVFQSERQGGAFFYGITMEGFDRPLNDDREFPARMGCGDVIVIDKKGDFVSWNARSALNLFQDYDENDWHPLYVPFGWCPEHYWIHDYFTQQEFEEAVSVPVDEEVQEQGEVQEGVAQNGQFQELLQANGDQVVPNVMQLNPIDIEIDVEPLADLDDSQW